jgi:hypothetical protein
MIATASALRLFVKEVPTSRDRSVEYERRSCIITPYMYKCTAHTGSLVGHLSVVLRFRAWAIGLDCLPKRESQ